MHSRATLPTRSTTSEWQRSKSLQWHKCPAMVLEHLDHLQGRVDHPLHPFHSCHLCPLSYCPWAEPAAWPQSPFSCWRLLVAGPWLVAFWLALVLVWPLVLVSPTMPRVPRVPWSPVLPLHFGWAPPFAKSQYLRRNSQSKMQQGNKGIDWCRKRASLGNLEVYVQRNAKKIWVVDVDFFMGFEHYFLWTSNTDSSVSCSCPSSPGRSSSRSVQRFSLGRSSSKLVVGEANLFQPTSMSAIPHMPNDLPESGGTVFKATAPRPHERSQKTLWFTMV